MTSKLCTFAQDDALEIIRIGYNALIAYAQNRATSSGALAIGTASKAKILVASTVNYLRAGIVRTGLTTAEVIIPSGASMPDDGTVRSVRVLTCINDSDAFVNVAGDVAANGATPGYPDIPEGYVLVGHTLISAAAGTAFVAGTTLLDAAGITDTYSNEQVPSWLLDDVTRAELGE